MFWEDLLHSHPEALACNSFDPECSRLIYKYIDEDRYRLAIPLICSDKESKIWTVWESLKELNNRGVYKVPQAKAMKIVKFLYESNEYFGFGPWLSSVGRIVKEVDYCVPILRYVFEHSFRGECYPAYQYVLLNAVDYDDDAWHIVSLMENYCGPVEDMPFVDEATLENLIQIRNQMAISRPLALDREALNRERLS